MLKVYGIKNCDTVKKVLNFLDQNQIEYEFIDFKKNAPTKEELLMWKKSFGDWPVNKRGRTYKMISDEFESGSDAQKIKILQDKTSSIKRPITTNGKDFSFGFDQSELQKFI